MPEHDTFDLDAAFARLERDIAGVSSPRGAGLAVTTARHRRRNRVGAMAAAAVLAVAGVAVAQGAHRHSSLEPTSPLPTPSSLDAAALTTATQGWTSAWKPTVGVASLVLNGPISRCLDNSSALTQVAEPVRASGDLSFSSGEAASFATLADFRNKTVQADALWTGLTATVSQCPNATLSGQQVWDGGEAVSYALTSPSGKTDHLWLARAGSTFGMLWVANATEPVPATDDTAVMTAIVSALQWPASYQDNGSLNGPTSTGSSTAVVDYPTVSDAAFARAVGDWATAWRPRGPKTDHPGLPCTRDPDTGGISGMGTGLGANGAQEYDTFDNVADAATSAATRVASLRACAGAAYEVHSLVTTSGGKVDVAAGTGTGDSVIWMVRDQQAIAYIQVPAGLTPPPDSVSTAVGDLLLSNLAQPQTNPAGGEPQKSGEPVTSSSSAAATR